LKQFFLATILQSNLTISRYSVYARIDLASSAKLFMRYLLDISFFMFFVFLICTTACWQNPATAGWQTQAKNRHFKSKAKVRSKDLDKNILICRERHFKVNEPGLIKKCLIFFGGGWGGFYPVSRDLSQTSIKRHDKLEIFWQSGDIRYLIKFSAWIIHCIRREVDVSKALRWLIGSFYCLVDQSYDWSVPASLLPCGCGVPSNLGNALSTD